MRQVINRSKKTVHDNMELYLFVICNRAIVTLNIFSDKKKSFIIGASLPVLSRHRENLNPESKQNMSPFCPYR